MAEWSHFWLKLGEGSYARLSSTLRGPWVQFELSYPSNLSHTTGVGRQVPNVEIGRTLPDGLLGWDAADESLRMFLTAAVVMLLAIVPRWKG